MILVDDRIPCDANGKPAFARNADERVYWVMILEKAYAKFAGSYSQMAGGTVTQGLEDITGGITTDGYNAPRARFDDQVCFDFMKGRCTRGASCRYSHDPNASGWDPNFGRRGRSPSPRRRYDSRDRYDDRRRSPPRRCCAVSVLIALVA